jgi:hypothetical protein
VDDSDLLTEEEADEDGAQPSDVASSSSSKVLLDRGGCLGMAGSGAGRIPVSRRCGEAGHSC